MITYDMWKLAEPDSYKDEVDDLETIEENSIENILNHLNVVGKMDLKKVRTALTMILNYSNEPGVTLTDLHTLLTEIIDSL